MNTAGYNIKIVEGNAFSLLFPLMRRTYVSSVPIDEDIVIEDLTDVVVKFGGVQYTAVADPRGLIINLPSDLARNTYDAVITAKYNGYNIQAAYFEAVTIVEWNFQSDAEQYIQGSPIAMRPAYVVGGVLSDAELEALKEEYREKNAQLDQAIAEAEAAKREWEEKAVDLDGVAQEATSQEILTKTEAAKDAAVEAKTAAQAITGYALQGIEQTATNTAIMAAIGYTIQEIDGI